MPLRIQIDSFGTRIQPQVHHVDVSLWTILHFTPGSCHAKCFMTALFVHRLCTAAGGLMPKNRITSSQPRFFRMSFWVTWSPSVSILTFWTSFYVTSLRRQTGNFGSSTYTASPSTCARVVFPESSVVASMQCLTHFASSFGGH